MNFRKLLLVVAIFTLFVGFLISCTTPPVVTADQRAALEKAQYLDFLKSYYQKLSDSAVAQTHLIDTLCVMPKKDSLAKDSFQLVRWILKTGVGDSITSGKTVSYRYKRYSICDTVIGKKIFEYSNYDSEYPETIVIDQISNRSYVNPRGLDFGLKTLKDDGHAILLLPSTLTDGQFVSYYYDLEIVYVSR